MQVLDSGSAGRGLTTACSRHALLAFPEGLRLNAGPPAEYLPAAASEATRVRASRWAPQAEGMSA